MNIFTTGRSVFDAIPRPAHSDVMVKQFVTVEVSGPTAAAEIAANFAAGGAVSRSRSDAASECEP